MKIICAGLSKTGTSSLGAALEQLGYSCIHYDEHRLNDVLEGRNPNPDFRRYDDIDAVLDVPSAFFFRELRAAYPSAKVILTVRDLEEWWVSIREHFNRLPILWPTWKDYVRERMNGSNTIPEWVENSRFRTNVRCLVYGSADAREFMYKKRYREHNEAVLHDVPPDRLLVMDIAAGDGWAPLCNFLGVQRPDTPFPHTNRAKDQKPGPTASPKSLIIPQRQ